jgi:adenylylsulfate kinase
MLLHSPRPVRKIQNMKKQGLTIWFTGLSGAGKTTISHGVADRLQGEYAIEVVLLDGDRIRQTLTNHLGFSKVDRAEQIRLIGDIARKSTGEGAIVLVAADRTISPA